MYAMVTEINNTIQNTKIPKSQCDYKPQCDLGCSGLIWLNGFTSDTSFVAFNRSSHP